MGLLTRFASQWVAGETLDDALRVARDANRRGIDALVNHLGEHYHEKAPVEATTREYLRLVSAMRDQGIRGHVSLKPTQFGVLIDRSYALAQMLPVLDATKADGRVLWLDMEGSITTDDTIRIGEDLRTRYERVGVCLQANLRRTADDLSRLLDRDIRVRLVKGAYKESPDIAFPTRAEIELARDHPTPFEFAMLQGVRDPLKDELVNGGHRVAEYIPYGPNWLPYFTRRLRERPRNIITMVRSFVSG